MLIIKNNETEHIDAYIRLWSVLCHRRDETDKLIENISKDIYFFSFLFKDENKIKDKTKIHKYWYLTEVCYLL